VSSGISVVTFLFCIQLDTLLVVMPAPQMVMPYPPVVFSVMRSALEKNVVLSQTHEDSRHARTDIQTWLNTGSTNACNTNENGVDLIRQNKRQRNWNSRSITSTSLLGISLPRVG